MKKQAVLTIEERLTYRREVTVILPEGMSEDELNKVLDIADRYSHFFGDYLHYLKNAGIEINEYDDSFDSPDESEVECWNIQFKEDEA